MTKTSQAQTNPRAANPPRSLVSSGSLSRGAKTGRHQELWLLGTGVGRDDARPPLPNPDVNNRDPYLPATDHLLPGS